MSDLDDDNTINTNGSIQSEESCRRFSLDEIQSATNNFDDGLVIGIGGFGKVYIAFIDNGATTVAIKRLKVESNQGAKEFRAEVDILSKLRHTNLIALIGCCEDCEEMILVYEYMANGTLADHLYQVSRQGSGIQISHLTLEQRLNICIGAVRGLDYLHTGTNQSFIHRDVKTTNILLDENLVAKISDFGLSKGTTSHSTTHVTTNVRGTYGYLDPHFWSTMRLTKKSDVYAIGVVLFEVMCGRKAVDTTLKEEQISLVSWAQNFIRKGKFDRIVDPSLSGQMSSHCLNYLVKLASECLLKNPKDRPTMAEVGRRLELALASQGERRTEGVITKVFNGIAIVPKGMDHCWRQRKGNETESGPSKDLPWEPPSKSRVTRITRVRYSFAEIEKATNGFNEDLLIGEGLSAKVYKGYMDGETPVVAIKRFKQNWLALEQFEAENMIWYLPSHPHIIDLIGYCNENKERILVLGYMVNGSLQDHLYGADNDPLQWKKRLKICIDAARGWQHILTQQIIYQTRVADSYGQINSSNILLDKNWVAKVSGSIHVNVQPIIGPVGRSYTDLLFGQGKKEESYNVQSFGKVLFEVLFAKKDCVPSVSSIKEGTFEIDPYLMGKVVPKCLTEFSNIASSCFFGHGQRPSMDAVVKRLEYALMLQEAWESRMKNGTKLPLSYTYPSSYKFIAWFGSMPCSKPNTNVSEQF